MQFILKNIWLVVFGILLLFRDTIFKTGSSNGRTDVEKPKTTSGATIDLTQAQQYAERLYQAMNTAGWTNLTEIWAVFKMLQNRADYNLVYNAFGLRQYSDLFGNVGMPTDPEVDLIGWMESELNQKEREKLVKDFPKLNLV